MFRLSSNTSQDDAGTSSTKSVPKAKASLAEKIIIALVVAVLIVAGLIAQHNETHHSVQLQIHGDPAIVKVTYAYSLPSPAKNQVAHQTSELSVSVPWETKFDIEGLEPTVTLKLVRASDDNRPLSCAVIMGDENVNKSMAPGQTEITCQGAIKKPAPAGATPSPSGTNG